MNVLKRTSDKPVVRRILPWLMLIILVMMWLGSVLFVEAVPVLAEHEASVIGRIIDGQGQPVAHAEVYLHLNGSEDALEETSSQPDGTFILPVPEEFDANSLRLSIERPHYETLEWEASAAELTSLRETGILFIDDFTLARRFSIGFWVATVAFVGMLTIIATERLHNTLAALLGVTVIFAVSLIGGAINPELFIFDFELALEFVDFEVIFLLLGMMIVIGIIEETGIFQKLAYFAYKLSGGRVWLLMIILMLVAAVVTAMLDNVTTMLLITPITIEIALALGLNPLSLVFPALMASNVGGISTLIGTPTNILIGSYAKLSFNDFLLNLTPGVLLAEAGLIIFLLIWYRKEHQQASGGISPTLLARLEENAKIKEPAKLIKAGIVFVILLALFIFGEQLHLTPAVSAIIGATVMLIWVHPDVEGMLGVVDWTTLIFFIGLFIVIGAVQEVGLIEIIATQIAELVGDSVVATMMTIVWSSAILSGIVDNIPFAAAMLPAVDFLTNTVPGIEGKMLFYALAVGTATGGNITLIASSSNLVVAGITERAGYRITFLNFLKIGVPVTLITAGLGSVWLLIHFL